VDTIEGAVYGPQRRRRHSAEFKTEVIAACRHQGVSIAAVALAHGLNANLLRRWVAAAVDGAHPLPAIKPAFVPVAIPPAVTSSAEISIEAQHGAKTVRVRWPVSAAGECATWLRDWLR
jgi:transposase-like protein